MSRHAVVHFLCALGVFHKGQTALIESQHTVLAAVGADARLNCQLMQSKDVVQVTWQKISSEGKTDLATYHKHFGQKVNTGFQGRVEFESAGLQNSSIVIRNVTDQDKGCYCCLFNTYPDGALARRTCLQLYGQTALIKSQHTVLAAVGEDVILNCQLMQSEDVMQVKWLKSLPEGEKILASNHKIYGHSVNPDYEAKVEFESAGLKNNSIVIRNVTDQDKGCYRCVLKYSKGDNTTTTCLQLYELHEAFLHVRESNCAEEVLVSCSATGRPAPTVTLTVPHYNSTSVTNTNTNGTVTVTTTAVLSRLRLAALHIQQVGCAVRVLSSPQIEVYAVIPEVKLLSADGFDVESGSDNSDFNFTWIIVLVFGGVCVCAAAAITILYKRKHQNRQNPQVNTCSTADVLESVSVSQRENEENKKDTHESRTPLMKQENELRLRTSSAKDKKSDQPKSSGKLTKCLFPE